MRRSTRSRSFSGQLMENGVASSKEDMQEDYLMSIYDVDSELRAISSQLDSLDGGKDHSRISFFDQLRIAQDKVVNLLTQLLNECNCKLKSRDHRTRLSDEILNSEGLFDNRSILQVERLSAGSDRLKYGCNYVTIDPKLLKNVVAFNQILAYHEHEYVKSIFSIRTVVELEKLREVAELFSEILIDLVNRNLIGQEDIDEFQPIVMIALPGMTTVLENSDKENPNETTTCSLLHVFQVSRSFQNGGGINNTVCAAEATKRTEPTKRVNKRKVRANVIQELINSERDFVKHLKDVVEGYLYPARRRPDIFTSEKINTIFANIEQLYEFQRRFLQSLEICINWQDLAASKVGRCFLEYEKGFSVYHYYCNNHPNATSELRDLYTKQGFVRFFEACRMLQNMIDISLDGFLLTPIQRICKYPLQLAELLKNTDEAHADYQDVLNALETMRNCANLANERKRRIEALADVMSFQEKVENWFGPKLNETSSILLHSGEVLKINTSNAWSQGVQLYLFDHLLIYCKRDILLKRSNLMLKGRICMDLVTVISDADECKPKRSFKLYCSEQQKWFVFITRSEKEKDEWIQAFERERNLVESDENEGFQITDREIGIARRALQHRKHSRSARYGQKQRPDTAIVDQIDLDDANMIMNRTLSLPSCIHPSHVMNFVEDSKVLSTKSAKGGQQLSPGSRSPGGAGQSSTQLQQQQQQLHMSLADDQHPDQKLPASGVNWFKKVGSRKLAKSQIYTINGQHSGTQSIGIIPKLVVSSNSPPSSSKMASSPVPAQLTAAQPITSDKAAIKYEELEKRHREHMSSEEQARLHRLNNDLPPPPSMFGQSPSNTGVLRPPISLSKRWSGVNTAAVDHQRLGGASAQLVEGSHRTMPNLRSKTDNQKASSDLVRRLNSTQPDNVHVHQQSGSSFETTLVLSSGRVVRVREDAV